MSKFSRKKVLRGLPDKWGDESPYSHVNEGPWVDTDGVEYEKVGSFLENDDFYQGLSMVTVIRHPDGTLYGYSWWEDISKYGEAYVDSNMYEYGYEYEEDQETLYVWHEVEEYPIRAFREKND